jgi:hypothetical protein
MGRAMFKQSDLVRALKAAQAAGLAVKSASIQNGQIVLGFADGTEHKEPETEPEENPWEEIIRGRVAS